MRGVPARGEYARRRSARVRQELAQLRQLQRMLRAEELDAAFVDATAVDMGFCCRRIAESVVGSRDIMPSWRLPRLAAADSSNRGDRRLGGQGSAGPYLRGPARRAVADGPYVDRRDRRGRRGVDHIGPPPVAFFDAVVKLAKWSPASIERMIRLRTEEPPAIAGGARGSSARESPFRPASRQRRARPRRWRRSSG